MLEAVQLSRQATPRDGDPQALLDAVGFSCPVSQVTLIVGAPGSGKHSLLEVLAGVRRQDQGVLLLHGRDLDNEPLHPNELGFVPATTDSLHGNLTARETLASALLLRAGGLAPDETAGRIANLLALCGLETATNERVNHLSAIQRRRLLLAAALVSDPVLVLCDDFTNGMDAKSERELVALLKLIATDLPGRVVLNVTASLSQLPAYDTTIVLHQGHVCFHGPARAIPHYFTIKSVEDLYPRLAMRPAQRWGDSWARHRDSYYEAFKISGSTEKTIPTAEDGAPDSDDPDRIRLPATQDAESEPDTPPAGEKDSAPVLPPPLPRAGLAAQATLLVRRRWTLLRRSRREWRLQALMFFGLPMLAVLMIWPNKGHLAAALGKDASALPPEILWPAAYTCLMAAFIQVFMVVFMSVRNGAREIARERAAIDWERLGGVSPLAVLVGKIAFLGPLILAQSLWLGLCVEMFIGPLPGATGPRLILLLLTGAAFTSLCLGISAHARAAERAHALCLLLTCAQVLLGGALLGMPRVLGGIIHPFVTAYYGWSGIVDGMSAHPVFPAITALLRTWFATPSLAMSALAIHAIAGLALAYAGLRKRRLP